MRIWNVLFVGAIAGVTASSYADNTLHISGINYGHADQAYIGATGVTPHELYVNSDYGTLKIGSTTYNLNLIYCADLKTPLGSLPVTYKVNLVPVTNEESWIITHIADQPGLTAPQDAGVQLAIWSLENPGLYVHHPNDSSMITYMNQDLTLGSGHSAPGLLLKYLSGGHGQEQTMIIAPPVPEPAPFLGLGLGLVGLAAFRRRRAQA